MGKYFSVQELCHSQVATQRGIDNTPPPETKTKLTSLISNLLDPIRELWGRPLTVNSGFRCPTLNQAVGGSSTSQHTRGEAADITAGNPKSNKKLFDLIIKSELGFDQLIDESNYSWIHISWEAKGNRKQILHL